MPQNLTPAEISATQIHILNGEKQTHCGIKFRHRRFLQKCTTLYEIADCEKCRKEKMRKVREGHDVVVTVKEIGITTKGQSQGPSK